MIFQNFKDQAFQCQGPGVYDAECWIGCIHHNTIFCPSACLNFSVYCTFLWLFCCSVSLLCLMVLKILFCRYVLDSRTAAPLILSMLEVMHKKSTFFPVMTICICFIFTKLYFKCIFQEILSSAEAACRTRAFDLILNLGVHAQLLEPMIVNDASTIEEEYSQESYYDSNTQVMVQESRKGSSQNKSDTVSAIDNFESWIINILHEILLLLVQVYYHWEEKDIVEQGFCLRFAMIFSGGVI